MMQVKKIGIKKRRECKFSPFVNYELVNSYLTESTYWISSQTFAE